MQRYEYRVDVHSYVETSNAEIERRLNELGADGYRLVHSVPLVNSEQDRHNFGARVMLVSERKLE